MFRLGKAGKVRYVKGRSVKLGIGSDWIEIYYAFKRKEIFMVYKIEERYEWRGAQYPVEPQVAGNYFKSLEEQYGKVTPENLLESSRPEDSVMHKCFQWDDAIAAEKYRKYQASSMITNLVKVVIKHNESSGLSEEIKTRAVVSVSPGIEKGEFVSIERAMSDSEMRDTVLKNALRELITFQEKYKNLGELEGVFESIENFKRNIGKE